jgi:pimeloyl-ACP methyl ester carboxylesterase
MGRLDPRGRAATRVTSQASSQPSGESEPTGRAQLANGNELHFVEMGCGPTVIFMHGGMGDCRSWGRQLEGFAPHYRAVAYSRRLHSPNRNPVPAIHPSLDDEAADLDSLQRALQTGPAHLVATSYGALVALAFALRHPLQVRSLVLAEPPLHHWAGATLRGRRLLRQFMGRCWWPARCAFDEGNDDQALRLLTDGMWGRPVYDSIPAARRVTAFHNAAAMKLLVGAADPLPDLPRDAVKKLSMSVLLVQGAWASGLHRRGLEELAGVLPNALRVVIESAGHASPSENPLGFNNAVLKFFRAQRLCETALRADPRRQR